MKEVDSREYISALKELILSGRSVSFLVTGNSMAPFLINKRDQVILAPLDDKAVKGDIIFFQRRDGTFVLHRVVKIGDKGYFLLGDAHRKEEIEGPVEFDRAFALSGALYFADNLSIVEFRHHDAFHFGGEAFNSLIRKGPNRHETQKTRFFSLVPGLSHGFIKIGRAHV